MAPHLLELMWFFVPDVHVVEEACDGKQAIELVPLYQPHVVLMDFYIPRMNGVKAARITKESWQEIAIIGISMAPDRSLQLPL